MTWKDLVAWNYAGLSAVWCFLFTTIQKTIFIYLLFFNQMTYFFGLFMIFFNNYLLTVGLSWYSITVIQSSIPEIKRLAETSGDVSLWVAAKKKI